MIKDDFLTCWVGVISRGIRVSLSLNIISHCNNSGIFVKFNKQTCAYF